MEHLHFRLDESRPSTPENNETTGDNELDAAFVSGLKEGISIHPAAVYANSFRYRAGNVLNAARSDVKHSPHKLRTVALGSLAIGTQILDRARISLILVPAVATEVMENTNQALPTAIAAAATFAAWNGSMGEVLNNGLGEYPKAIDSFKGNFPAVVDVFSESLPGLEADDTVSPQEKQSRFRAFFRKIGLHTRRAATGIGIGSTAFVATNHAQGKSKSEVRKTNLAVTADTGILVGGIAGATVETIKKLAERGHVELAKDIQSAVTDMRLWYGVAVLSMISKYVSNRRRRAQLIRADSRDSQQG